MAARNFEVKGRFVLRDQIVTSAGVTAGLDPAFFLAADLAGVNLANATRLSMEYRLEETLGYADPRQAPEAIRVLATTGLTRPQRDRGN